MSDSADSSALNGAPFGFRRKPFSGGDAEFFFTNTGYLDGYVRLLDSLRQQRGLIVLTGAAGTGKTLLLRKLTHEAPAQIKFIFCYSTNLDFDELLTLICNQLSLETHGQDRPHRLKAIQEYLAACRQQGSVVALLIDEAHHLLQNVLSRLLTLLQLTAKSGHPLQLVLSGAPVLEEQVTQQQALYPVAAQAVYIRLERLSPADVAAFIQRQLQAAGATPELFPAAVIARIAHYSQGIPRLINSLCDHALLIAQLYEQAAVTPAMIDEAAGELMLPDPDPYSKTQSLPAPPTPVEQRPATPPLTLLPGTQDRAAGFSGDTRLWPQPVVTAPEATQALVVQPPASQTGRLGPARAPRRRAALLAAGLLILLAGSTGGYLLIRHFGLPAALVAGSTPPAPGMVQAPETAPLVQEKPPVVAAATGPAPAGLAETAAPAPEAATPPAATAPVAAGPVPETAPAAPPSGESVATAAIPPSLPETASPPQPVAVEQAASTVPVPVADYMRKGDRLLELGDTASARLFYEAAAQAGHAQALTAVGRTYDPRLLSRQGLQGVYADAARAEQWYLKAAQAGDAEAESYLTELRRWLAESPPLDKNPQPGDRAPPPAPRPNPQSAPPAPATRNIAGGGYTVQVGAFRQRAAAERHRAAVAFLGIRAYIQTIRGKDHSPWYQVHIGPFANAGQAEALRQRLQKNNIQAVVVAR